MERMHRRCAVALAGLLLAAATAPALADGLRLAVLDPRQMLLDTDRMAGPSTAVSAPAVSAVPAVKRVRIGRHAASTRVVLDVEGRPRFDHYTTASGRSVLIHFPAVRWQAPPRLDDVGGVVGKYRFGAAPGPAGDLAILASHPVVVEKAFVLPPDPGVSDHHRLVIDLMPQGQKTPPAETGFGSVQVRLEN